jgi:hypothetical protein
MGYRNTRIQSCYCAPMIWVFAPHICTTSRASGRQTHRGQTGSNACRHRDWGPLKGVRNCGNHATALIQDICPGDFPGCVADQYKFGCYQLNFLWSLSLISRRSPTYSSAACRTKSRAGFGLNSAIFRSPSHSSIGTLFTSPLARSLADASSPTNRSTRLTMWPSGPTKYAL